MIFWVTRIIRWIRMAFQAVQNTRRQWAPELQQLSDHIEKLEDSLAGTDDCVLDIYSLEETHGNRMDALQEELASVKGTLSTTMHCALFVYTRARENPAWVLLDRKTVAV